MIGDVPVVITALGGVILVIDVVSQNKAIDHNNITGNITGREVMGHEIDTMTIDTEIEVVLLEGDDDYIYTLYMFDI